MDDFLEAILLWTKRGQNEAVIQWLQKYGLTVTPISSGLLLAGNKTIYEETFDIDLTNVDLPFQLPIPARYREYVASISIPSPRIPY